MEIEPSTHVVAKKLWNIVRVMFFMLRKGIAKSKIMVEFHFHLMLKRGKKALVNNLMLNHHYYYMTSFTCRDNNNNTFISPRDYEFSCSNSPAIPFHVIKRNNKHHRFSTNNSSQYHDVSTLTAVHKVLDILNNENNNNNSPLVSLPGFGKSPIGRQLRVTDSPFPLHDEGDSQVDAAAEEFIKKFYKNLNLQKKMAPLESPFHNSWVR